MSGGMLLWGELEKVLRLDNEKTGVFFKALIQEHIVGETPDITAPEFEGLIKGMRYSKFVDAEGREASQISLGFTK